mmetsp:Transcript_5370/g.7877  ORF Transcript_5370/g.7877 Transcript_5370/m.7877 type:complete len:131 (+) Transcript_5370:249-641(+)
MMKTKMKKTKKMKTKKMAMAKVTPLICLKEMSTMNMNRKGIIAVGTGMGATGATVAVVGAVAITVVMAVVTGADTGADTGVVATGDTGNKLQRAYSWRGCTYFIRDFIFVGAVLLPTENSRQTSRTLQTS